MICIDSSSIHELSIKKLNSVKVVVPNVFVYPHIYALVIIMIMCGVKLNLKKYYLHDKLSMSQ